MMKLKKWSIATVVAITGLQYAGCKVSSDLLKSPDKQLAVNVWTDKDGKPWYTVARNGVLVLDTSALGVKFNHADYEAGLSLKAAKTAVVNDTYETINAKRKSNSYKANQQVYELRNKEGKGFDLIFQLSDDGVVFRYFFPDIKDKVTIEEEATTFKFPTQTKGWLQPMAVAKSGWEQTNPSYEEHYQQGVAVGTKESTNTGWIYPALFQVDTNWVLITEAGLDGKYSATRLAPDSPGGVYKISFPDSREVMPQGALKPNAAEPFYSPWRVLTVGSLATITESTLGTDIADKAIEMDLSVIKPGKSSWSWINSKDDFIVYDEQKKYIDFAADMNWQYCLIDVNWDKKIGYDKMKELADYAATKNVGLLLWYNSAGSWNTVKYTPKDRLLTSESRNEEFARIKAMGIKGVKIDFFGGDGQSVIQYYIDILNDAAKHGLLVNFHGATLPRGWSRTYPHLMTVEAVRGFEMVTFGQEDADRQATHSAILPFTRNAFDPMDFTPMNLHKIPTHVQRKTTAAFELATSVLFLSGIQHFAESPEGMAHVSEAAKTFLQRLPDSWDDVKFIDGFPGKEVVIARQSGNRWIIAGINGETSAKQLKLNLSGFGKKEGTIFKDVDGKIETSMINLSVETVIEVLPNGGFVIEL